MCDLEETFEIIKANLIDAISKLTNTSETGHIDLYDGGWVSFYGDDDYGIAEKYELYDLFVNEYGILCAWVDNNSKNREEQIEITNDTLPVEILTRLLNNIIESGQADFNLSKQMKEAYLL